MTSKHMEVTTHSGTLSPFFEQNSHQLGLVAPHTPVLSSQDI